ncbi:MAG: ATP-binding protein [Schwartzia sp.]|nr:ATP-binding protein [Schwartzia sp. (in: firmicutes)]
MKLIERPHYLQRLAGLRGTPDIKIITGLRRSGKSKLLQAFMERIAADTPEANLIFVDFMALENEPLKEYHALYEYVEARFRPGAENLLFIDEIQMCSGFELAINSLHAKEKYDIYVTGSNAFLLSADLATLFTGRYIELHVFPFSFEEYCRYYQGRGDRDTLFDAYATQGGLAGSYAYPAEQDRAAYIAEVYNTVVNRDLVQKYRLPDTLVLDRLAEFLMDNIGNLTSANRISNTLVSNKVSTSHVTVGRYIKYLCSSFLFYPVRRFDIRGRKYLETSEKYYLADTGIRQSILGTRNMDYGRLYENLVCLELFRRGYEVYAGKLYAKEIDFVAKKAGEQLYIQVSDNIENPDTFRREYEPLLKIRDAYPRLIVARTRHDTYTFEGISVVDIAGWLAAVPGSKGLQTTEHILKTI